MKDKKYTLSTVLIAVMTVLLLILVILRAVNPNLILPIFDIPMITGISLIALVLDHYLAPGAKRCWVCIPVFAARASAFCLWRHCWWMWAPLAA